MGRHSSIPLIYDFCYSLSTKDLRMWEYLKPNSSKSGKISFHSYFKGHFEIDIKVSMLEAPYMEYSYNKKKERNYYRVYFETIKSNLGKGLIYYFKCPVSGIRCRTLHFIGGIFSHRSNFPEGYYQTQTLGSKDKILIRNYDLLKKAYSALKEQDRKYFKKYYRGYPTKRFLKNKELIRKSYRIR